MRAPRRPFWSSAPRTRRPSDAQVQVASADAAWTSLLIGDLLDTPLPYVLGGALAALLLFALACSGGRSRGTSSAPAGPAVNALSREDAFARVRAALTDGKACFEGDARYCIADPAVLDPLIQKTLDQQYQGTMPGDPRQVDRVADSAGVAYSQYLTTPAGLAGVEAKLRAIWDAPAVSTLEDGTVKIDAGLVAGHLRTSSRGYNIEYGDSDLLVRGELASAEVGRILSVYAAQHPSAPTIMLVARVPIGLSRPDFTYRYERARDRVVVTRSDTPLSSWTSKSLGGSLACVVSGGVSLHTSDLEYCHQSRERLLEGDCP